MTLRGRVRSSVRWLCESAAYRPVLSAFGRRHYCIVLSHFIGESVPEYCAAFTPTSTTPSQTLADLTTLARVFRFVSLTELLATDSDVAPSDDDRPSLVVTYDDGLDIFPAAVIDGFQRLGIRPTLFLTTDCLDNRTLMWRHALSTISYRIEHQRLVREFNLLAEQMFPYLQRVDSAACLLRETMRLHYRDRGPLVDALWSRLQLPPIGDYLGEHRPYLTTSRVQDLLRLGFEIGLHSGSHPRFDTLPTDAIEAEVMAPAQLLRQRFGISNVPFAYPFGVRAERVLESQILATDVIPCVLGTAGFSPRGANTSVLQRISIEGDPLAALAAPFYSFASRHRATAYS